MKQILVGTVKYSSILELKIIEKSASYFLMVV